MTNLKLSTFSAWQALIAAELTLASLLLLAWLVKYAGVLD
jgi:hypothetical protein